MNNSSIISRINSVDDDKVIWSVQTATPRFEGNPRVYIFRGIPGSGKSTVARNIAENVKNVTVVSRDEIRKSILGEDKFNSGYIYSQEKDFLSSFEDSVTEILSTQVSLALKSGNDVIIDNTNIKSSYVAQAIGLAMENKADPVVVVSWVDIDTAIKRVRDRSANGSHDVPEHVVRSMYNSFKNSMRSWNKLDNGVEHYINRFKNGASNCDFDYTYNPSQANMALVDKHPAGKAYLFDIDGTVAKMVPNAEGDTRSPYDWERVGEDAVNAPVVDTLIELKKAGFEIVLMSGRSSESRANTEKWLAEHEIPYDGLYMRAAGDTRDDAQVKVELLQEAAGKHLPIVAAFDDRDRVVAMWRKVGITCFQVDYGNF